MEELDQNKFKSSYDFYIGDNEILKYSTKPVPIVFFLNKSKDILGAALVIIGFVYLMSVLTKAKLHSEGLPIMLLMGIIIFFLISIYDYLKIRNTIYFITNERTIIYSSFINKNIAFTYNRSIKETNIKCSFIDNIFKTGDIKFFSGEYKESKNVMIKEFEKINAIKNPKEFISIIRDNCA